MPEVTTLVRALQARRSGKGWMAKCPAHDDRNPSLSISEVDGKVLVHCQAGCPQRDVIETLKSRGLWHPDQFQKALQRQPTFRERIDKTYDYTDEMGELLYQVVRLRDPKGFRQRRPDGNGGWIWRKGARQVLYHLPELLEAPIVFVVKGEKDVESLRDHGFVATTNAGGAKASWSPEFTDALAHREVILIPDNDAPGKDRVLAIARALIGRARPICVIEFDAVKDITEWFDSGHSELELIVLVEGQTVAR
jgi:putative DNA primase/helicase